MRRNLKDIFYEAEADRGSRSLRHYPADGIIGLGILIEYNKKTQEIKIQNTTIGGDYYKEITDDQYEIFYEYGWKYGIYVVALSNYRRKLDKIESQIKREVNTRKNAKHIHSLKQSRERILQRYGKVSQKLNLIKQSNEGQFKTMEVGRKDRPQIH